MSRTRGEDTSAIVVRGEAESQLVPFVFEGVKYQVPAGVLRHHPDHPGCPMIVEALKALNSWRETIRKGLELRVRTVRCTGGCWAAYEASEQIRIARGDKAALKDWNEDGVRARAALVQKVDDGLLPGSRIAS